MSPLLVVAFFMLVLAACESSPAPTYPTPNGDSTATPASTSALTTSPTPTPTATPIATATPTSRPSPTPTATPTPTLTPTPTTTPTPTPTITPTPGPTPTPLPSLEWRSVPTFQYEPAYPCGDAIFRWTVFPDPDTFQQGYLEWSSGRDEVFFSYGATILRVSADGSNLGTVVDADPRLQYQHDSYNYGFHADVSPHGDSIVYSTCGLPTQPPASWTRNLTLDLGSLGAPPDFWLGHPATRHYEIATTNVDGSEILLYSGTVHVVKPDGTGLRRVDISRWPFQTILASWSPDGARIVIHYSRSNLNGPGDNLLFTVDRNGADLRLIARREPEIRDRNTGNSHEGRWVSAYGARDDVSRDLAACGEGLVVPQPEANPELVQDCETLLRLRDALAGSAELAWNAQTPIGEWEGITIGGTPLRVEELVLQDRGLTGSLPPELGELSELRMLDASNTGHSETVWNVLTGSLPPELGNLKKLQTLDLSRNLLSGDIPPELGNMTSLESLDFDHNLLTGAPPRELNRLTNLTVLLLRGNLLSGEVPSALGQLPSLRALDLSHNRLSGSIPPGLGGSASLRRLNLRGNRLSGEIPPELGSIEGLWYLHLNDNMLTGDIPPELGQLTQLDGLYLQGNALTGSIPAELGRLTRLRELHLERNALTGDIPAELGPLTQVRELWLQHNALTGNIPPELGRLTQLRTLYLHENDLTGSIPVELSALSNLNGPIFLPNSFSGCVAVGLPDVWITWSGLPRCESE